jgi:hypothetical protein
MEWLCNCCGRPDLSRCEWKSPLLDDPIQHINDYTALKHNPFCSLSLCGLFERSRIAWIKFITASMTGVSGLHFGSGGLFDLMLELVFRVLILGSQKL